MILFIDFDNTMVESNAKIIQMLNDKYSLNKDESSLTDYDFNSIVPIAHAEKAAMFESDDFFTGLQLKPGFLDFLNKFAGQIDIKVSTRGTDVNIAKKTAWIKENVPYNLDIIGINSKDLSKRSVDMTSGIQVDDCTEALDTNADVKILYKDGNNFSWQRGYDNQDITVVNTWEEITEIVNFYLIYDYKTLERRK